MCFIVQETVDTVVVAVHNERVELVNVLARRRGNVIDHEMGEVTKKSCVRPFI